MSDVVIDAVGIVDCTALAGPGDDTQIVAVHAGRYTGWYGPVAAHPAMLIHRRLGRVLIGTAVTDHNGVQARLRSAAGAVIEASASWAIGALDCAVWDLHGRIERRTVAQLLTRSEACDTVPAYGSWLRLDIGQSRTREAARRVADEGWAFTKWGLRRRSNDIQSEAKLLAETAQEVARAAGAPVAIDALSTWDTTFTQTFTDTVDPAAITWLEEPLPGYDLDGYARLTPHAIPLALGEHLKVDDDPEALLIRAAPGAFTIDVVGCGGLTAAVAALDHAEGVGIPVYPHGRSLLPALHLAAAYPGIVPAVEYQIQWQPRRQRLFHEPLARDGGQLALPGPSGLGATPRRP